MIKYKVIIRVGLIILQLLYTIFRLLDSYPNTYAYTKQIAEDVVKQEGHGMPVGIVRPSIGKKMPPFPPRRSVYVCHFFHSRVDLQRTHPGVDQQHVRGNGCGSGGRRRFIESSSLRSLRQRQHSPGGYVRKFCHSGGLGSKQQF